MNRIIFRAGWPDLGDQSWSWRSRFGKWWVWVGPYVIGTVKRF